MIGRRNKDERKRKGTRYSGVCMDMYRVYDSSRFNIFGGVIMKKMSKEEFEKQHVVCECGYHNFKELVKRYGTCRRCGKVLDPKAKLEYERVCRLGLWRKNEKVYR